MPVFLFGQGSGPLGSGGTGPAPVLRDLFTRVGPDPTPAEHVEPPGITGVLSGLGSAGDSTGVFVRITREQAERDAVVRAFQAGRPNVALADP